MAVLICKKCKGYYKLKERESLEDFIECECGGELENSKYKYAFLYEDETKVNFHPSELVSKVKKPALEIINYTKLRHVNNINTPTLNSMPKFPEIKAPLSSPRFPKMPQFKNEYIYYLLIFVISLITIDSILYVPDVFSLIMKNQAIISIVLAVMLFFSYIYNESNKDNKILNSLLKISFLFIVPFLIAFASIMLNVLIHI